MTQGGVLESRVTGYTRYLCGGFYVEEIVEGITNRVVAQELPYIGLLCN